MNTNASTPNEPGDEDLGQEIDRGCLGRSDRGHLKDHSMNELDPLALEDTHLDHLIVFGPRDPPRLLQGNELVQAQHDAWF